MSREAFEAALKSKKITGVGIDFGRDNEGGYFVSEVNSAWLAWQSALAYAYEDAARVCDGMHPEVWPSAYADAIRERAKEATR